MDQRNHSDFEHVAVRENGLNPYSVALRVTMKYKVDGGGHPDHDDQPLHRELPYNLRPDGGNMGDTVSILTECHGLVLGVVDGTR